MVLELEHDERFALHIKVFGVGGAGGNALGHMAGTGLKGVDLVAVNTDAQALGRCKVPEKIQIGAKLTRGLGSGSRPDTGRMAAEEDRKRLRDALSGANLVFIVAGLGGGTGTGASPVIAEIARELGALVVGVVTRPFKFEGLVRNRQAEEGARALVGCADSVITISNDKLFKLVKKSLPLHRAFAVADDLLTEGIQAISSVVSVPGLINLDFADLKSIISEGGAALLGVGKAKGAHRAAEAARRAVECPLLETADLAGASGLLLHITGPRDLSLTEVHEAAQMVCREVATSGEVIFGATVDESLKGEVRVTVVATGLALISPRPRPPRGEQTVIHFGQWSPEEEPSPLVAGSLSAGAGLDEDLDVPTFLRKAR